MNAANMYCIEGDACALWGQSSIGTLVTYIILHTQMQVLYDAARGNKIRNLRHISGVNHTFHLKDLVAALKSNSEIIGKAKMRA